VAYNMLTQTLRLARRWIPPIVGLVLLIVLFVRSDTQTVFDLLWNADKVLLSVAVLLSIANLTLGVFRWKTLLRHLNVNVSTITLLRFVTEAIAINLFIPSGLAGEFARAFNLHKNHSDGGAAYSSVITDKLLGLIAFLLLAIAAIAFEWSRLENSGVVLPISIVGFILITGTAVLYSRRLSALLDKALAVVPQLSRIWTPLSVSLQKFREAPFLICYTLFMAFAAHFAQILCTWVIGLSLGIEIGLMPYFLYVPIIALVAALPISNSGLGVRESSFVFLLALVGVSAESALALSLIFTCLALIIPGTVGLALLALGPSLKADPPAN